LPKAVIWDFDETLARRSGRWSDTLVEALNGEAPGHPWTASSFMPGLSHGFPWHDWERGHPELADPDRWWNNLRPVLRGAMEQAGVSERVAERVSARFRSEYVRLDRWATYPDAEPALDRLRLSGWRQAILSNHCPELPDLVRGLGLWDYFDVVLTSAEIGFEKPHPEAFARAVRDLGHPDPVWMIGDSPQADIAGAARCGIRGVLVRRPAPGFAYAPDLSAAIEMIEQETEGQLDDVDSEMVRYYAARADEYDDWYLRRGRYSHGVLPDEAWMADLKAAATWLESRPFSGRIVELAAGTGWWSPSLARRGQLDLYDAAPEPLARARARLAEAGLVANIAVRDAWAEPERSVDGLFTGFWISHIDRAKLDDFFELVAGWLAPGGLFAFIDSRQDPESGAPDHRPPQDDVQVRNLGDGSRFRVRKVFYEPADLESALRRAGFTEIEVVTTNRFFVLGSARRR
jgi:putative hydrolase of the HAD superfamily